MTTINSTHDNTNAIYEVHVSHTNSKLGADIPSINLPAGVTCRPDAPCRTQGCYAMKGNWLFPTVKQSLLGNLRAYKQNPNKYFNDIAAKTALARFVRWHSSGDIPDTVYLAGMCKVARKNKNTDYLAFTKRFEMVNDFISAGKKIPKNLHIIFSAWENFMPENPYSFPVTYVWSKNFDNSAIPKDAIPCAGKCDHCLACWKLKKTQSVYFKKH